MLRYSGKLYCPHCETDLVHDLGESSAAAMDIPPGEGRWVCRRYGYSRPVVYAVDRRKGMVVASMRSAVPT